MWLPVNRYTLQRLESQEAVLQQGTRSPSFSSILAAARDERQSTPMSAATIYLKPTQFGERADTLVSAESLTATTSRTDTGVCLLQLRNAHGSIVVLPFQDNKSGPAEFGRELTMRSQFSEPQPTRDFLANFGGFLQHWA